MSKQTKKVKTSKKVARKAKARRARPTVKAQMKKASGATPASLSRATEALRNGLAKAPVSTKPAEKPKSTNIFKTLVIRGLTRRLGDGLKADGFTYSWAYRCWHKTGMDNELARLVKRYSPFNVTCEIQREAIKDEGTNPMAFRGLPAKKEPKASPQQRRARFQNGRKHLRDAAKANEAQTDVVKALLSSEEGKALVAAIAQHLKTA